MFCSIEGRIYSLKLNLGHTNPPPTDTYIRTEDPYISKMNGNSPMHASWARPNWKNVSFECIFNCNGISVTSNTKRIEKQLTLIQGRFGSTVGVPTAKRVVTNRSHSCTQIGNDRHTSFGGLSGSCFQQSSHVLHTRHKIQKVWKWNGRVQSNCIIFSRTSSVSVSLKQYIEWKCSHWTIGLLQKEYRMCIHAYLCH